MNTPHPSSLLVTSANVLPKLAALAFLVIWGTSRIEVPLERLGLVFGAFALFEALTAAALKKETPLLAWGDLPLLIQCLFAPAALPLYALIAAGVVFLGGEPDHGRRLPITVPTERGNVQPRFSPSTRNISTPPSAANPLNPAPGASSQVNPPRPPFNPAPRPSFAAPTASSRPAAAPSAPAAATPPAQPRPATTPSAPPSPAPASTTPPKP